MANRPKIVQFTPDLRLERLMRRIQAIHESGHLTWSMAVAAQIKQFSQAGLGTLDLDRLIETGSIQKEETIISDIGGDNHELVRKFVIGGLTVRERPALYTVEVRRKRLGVVTHFEWL